MILPPSKSSSAKSDLVSDLSPISKAKSSAVSSSSLSVIFLGLPASSYSLYHSVILRGLVGALKKQPLNFLGEDGAVKLITSILLFLSF